MWSMDRRWMRVCAVAGLVAFLLLGCEPAECGQARAAIVSGDEAALDAALAALGPGADDVACRDSERFELIHRAAMACSVPALDRLLDRGVAIEAPGGRQDKSPLYLAAKFGCVAGVDRLIARGADVNTRSSIGGTPLYVAAELHNVRVVSALLAAGADPELAIHARHGGMTPLLWSASQRHPDTAVESLLLERGASTEVRTCPTARTALVVAIQHRRADLARLLVEAGANIDAVDADGFTPLDYAHEQPELAAWLRERGGHARPLPVPGSQMAAERVLVGRVERAWGTGRTMLGASCELRVTPVVPVHPNGFSCQVHASCGGALLYGGPGTGFMACSEPGGALYAFDPWGVGTDQDASLLIDEAASTVVIDDAAIGASSGVRVRLGARP